MSTAAKKIWITPEEYLARERLAEFKSEYCDGQIYAMSGAGRPHNLVAANLARVIGNQIVDRPCELYIGDARVCVEPKGLYTYPDVVVACDEPRFLDNQFDTLLNPTLIVEILSPSTETWDRGGKAIRYRGLESLRELVFVAQDRPFIERYSRREPEWSFDAWEQLEDLVRLESIGCELRLRDIYHKVRFPAEPDRAGR